MKKRVGLVLLLVLVGIFMFSGLITAGFSLGNSSYNVPDYFAPGVTVIGWINLSLTNEPFDSLLSGFSQNIKIKDFLDNNSISYTCSAIGCGMNYAASSPNPSKTFTLNSGESRVIGLKITNNNLIDAGGINHVSLKIASNVGESCINPLDIDAL